MNANSTVGWRSNIQPNIEQTSHVLNGMQKYRSDCFKIELRIYFFFAVYNIKCGTFHSVNLPVVKAFFFLLKNSLCFHIVHTAIKDCV